MDHAQSVEPACLTEASASRSNEILEAYGTPIFGDTLAVTDSLNTAPRRRSRQVLTIEHLFE